MKYRVRAVAGEWMSVDKPNEVAVRYVVDCSWLGLFWTSTRRTFDTAIQARAHIDKIETTEKQAVRFNRTL